MALITLPSPLTRLELQFVEAQGVSADRRSAHEMITIVREACIAYTRRRISVFPTTRAATCQCFPALQRLGLCGWLQRSFYHCFLLEGRGKDRLERRILTLVHVTSDRIPSPN